MYNSLLKVSVNNREWNTVAHIANSYASEFLEGDIESIAEAARIKFNTLLNKLPEDCLLIIRDTSPFSYVKEVCNKLLE